MDVNSARRARAQSESLVCIRQLLSSFVLMRVVSSAEFTGHQIIRSLSTTSVLPLASGSSLGSFSVTVLHLDGEMSQSSHTSGTLTSSSAGLDGPIIASDFATGATGSGVMSLLLVPVLLATVATERM